MVRAGEPTTRVVGGASTDPATPQGQGSGEVPARVGRYTVVRRIGVGGMGEVFEAVDPELDRRVAVKLVKSGRDESAAHAGARLRREAQALASLSHPNVVPVFDVGEHGGQLFVAMELIEGQTMSQWLRTEPSLQEIVHALLAAGRGLAAAHAAGVVHRDFKPSNVMVGSGQSGSRRGRLGRVRVLDFGLARGTETSAAVSVATPPQSSGSGRFGESPSDLTATGVVMGTPAFLAPEQFQGRRGDARSDQFSFCVTAYRALYRQAPFEGSNFESLRDNVLAGRLRDPPRGSAVPRRVWTALARGLARQPEDRHNTLAALLDELRRAIRPRRFRILLPVVAVVAAVGIFGVWWWTTNHASCDSVAAPAESVWDDARRASVRAPFSASGLPFAEAAFDRVDTSLASYLQSWAEARIEACELGMARRVATEELGARVRCLRRALDTTAALIEELQRADVDMVAAADDAVRGLPDPSACRSPSGAAPEPAPQDVADVDAELDRLRASLLAGRYEAVADRVRRVRDRAVAIGYTPTVARAQALAADVESKLGHYEASRAAYEAARQAHAELGDLRGEIRMQLQLAYILAEELARPEEGLTQIRHARALSRRLDDPVVIAARIEQREGAVQLANGDLGAAEAALRRAYKLAGASEESRLRAVLDATRSTLATVLARRGRFDEAIELMRANVESLEERLGSEHPSLATSLCNLGASLNQRGRYDEARDVLERSRDIYLRSTGGETPGYATVLHNLGSLHAGLDEFAKAEEFLREAVAIKRGHLGIDHPSTAWATTDLGTALMYQDRPQEALPFLRDAVQGFERSQGDASAGQVFALNSLLQVLVSQGRLDEAKGNVDRALRLTRAQNVDPAGAGTLRWAVADVLWKSGGDRQRAMKLAREAKAMLEASVRPVDRQIETIDAWITEAEASIGATKSDGDAPRDRKLAQTSEDGVKL